MYMQMYENSWFKIGVSIAASRPPPYTVRKLEEWWHILSHSSIVRCRCLVVLLVAPVSNHFESPKHLSNCEEPKDLRRNDTC